MKKSNVFWPKQTLETSSNDSGKLYILILSWSNWISSASLTKIYHEGQIVTYPAKLAEIINNFFVNKIDKIRQNIP